MLLIKQTQHQLNFRYHPYAVWIVAASLIFGIPLLILLISLNTGWILYLWWMPLFFPSVIILGILGLLFAGRVVTYQFDKDYNSFALKRHGLLKTKVIWHSLTEILDIQVQSTSWHRDRKANYQIVIYLKSGNSLPLHLGISSTQEQLETVNLIRHFLGMKPQKFDG